MTLLGLTLGGLVACGGGGGGNTLPETRQAILSTRSAKMITVDGLQFRDLDGNGQLTPYEDWRLTSTQRTADLMGRMTFEQKAGLLVHGTLPVSGISYALTGVNSVTDLIGQRMMTTFTTRLSTTPSNIATANNLVQEIAEKQPLGIPVVISTDPLNGFSVTAAQTVASVGTTAMPDPIATSDPALVRQRADIVRQEYRAVGINEALSPQADIATEPR